MNDTTMKQDTKKIAKTPEPAGVHPHGKHRRHGYRGYPNNQGVGGRIHTGTGFGGVGSTGTVDTGTSVFTPKTLESVEELEGEPTPGQPPRRG